MVEPERHKDGDRNVIITQATNDLDEIINHHDPETDAPIKQGVWDRLDKMALDIERHAVSRITRYFPESK